MTVTTITVTLAVDVDERVSGAVGSSGVAREGAIVDVAVAVEQRKVGDA